MGSKKEVSLKNFLNTHYKPGLELRVGSDSQNFSKCTVYVSTIVLRYPNNGAKVIFQKEKFPKVNDLWSRLWKEAERSVEIASYLKENEGITVSCIDMDYNTDPIYPSNKVWKAAKGYAESIGFPVKAKPELLWATWAANSLCS